MWICRVTCLRSYLMMILNKVETRRVCVWFAAARIWLLIRWRMSSTSTVYTNIHVTMFLLALHTVWIVLDVRFGGTRDVLGLCEGQILRSSNPAEPWWALVQLSIFMFAGATLNRLQERGSIIWCACVPDGGRSDLWWWAIVPAASCGDPVTRSATQVTFDTWVWSSFLVSSTGYTWCNSHGFIRGYCLSWLFRSTAQISGFSLDVLVSNLLHSDFVLYGRVVRCRALTWMATEFAYIDWDSRFDYVFADLRPLGCVWTRMLPQAALLHTRFDNNWCVSLIRIAG